MEERNKVEVTISDKAFSRLLFTSVLSILICIACLCTASYAWFSDSAPSKGNQINMATDCLLTVTVSKDGVPLENIENGVELEAGVAYTVLLSLPADTASGYCLIAAGGETYYTDYILRHSEPEAQTVTFTLTVEETQRVKFTPRWGIYAADSDVKEGTLVIPKQ